MLFLVRTHFIWLESMSRSPAGDWHDFYMQFPERAVGYDFTDEIGETLYDLTDRARVFAKIARLAIPGGPLMDGRVTFYVSQAPGNCQLARNARSDGFEQESCRRYGDRKSTAQPMRSGNELLRKRARMRMTTFESRSMDDQQTSLGSIADRFSSSTLRANQWHPQQIGAPQQHSKHGLRIRHRYRHRFQQEEPPGYATRTPDSDLRCSGHGNRRDVHHVHTTTQ